MTYKIIKPFLWDNDDLMGTPKKELRLEYNRYIEMIPERISYLRDSIRSTRGYENWSPDFSLESLIPLCSWLKTKAGLRPMTEKERSNYILEFGHLTKNIESECYLNTELTDSLSFDTAIYYSETVLNVNKKLSRIHFLNGSRNNMNFGRPVLAGKTKFYFDINQVVQVIIAQILYNEYDDPRDDIFIETYYNNLDGMF
ncbi:MAG: hypothetical protein KAH48_09825 [Chlorobi bacterium]|nr:hypothetical protein [Chlorobiota bacterium]